MNNWEEEFNARDLLAVHLKDEKRFDEARISIKKAKSCILKNSKDEKLAEYVVKVNEFLEALTEDERSYNGILRQV